MPLRSTCPRCYRPVFLPNVSEPTTWLRCPLCEETFQLKVALAFQPPLLEVLDEADLQVSSSTAGATTAAVSSDSVFQPEESTDVKSSVFVSQVPEPEVVTSTEPKLQAKPQEFNLADFSNQEDLELENQDTEPALKLEPSKEDLSIRFNPTVFKPAMDAESTYVGVSEDQAFSNNKNQRKRASDKNPIVEGLKIILGGVAGLTIGYLGLLWTLQRDVLPPLAQYVPAVLLPEALLQSQSNTTFQPPGYTPSPQANSPERPLEKSTFSVEEDFPANEDVFQPAGVSNSEGFDPPADPLSVGEPALGSQEQMLLPSGDLGSDVFLPSFSEGVAQDAGAQDVGVLESESVGEDQFPFPIPDDLFLEQPSDATSQQMPAIDSGVFSEDSSDFGTDLTDVLMPQNQSPNENQPLPFPEVPDTEAVFTLPENAKLEPGEQETETATLEDSLSPGTLFEETEAGISSPAETPLPEFPSFEPVVPETESELSDDIPVNETSNNQDEMSLPGSSESSLESEPLLSQQPQVEQGAPKAGPAWLAEIPETSHSEIQAVLEQVQQNHQAVIASRSGALPAESRRSQVRFYRSFSALAESLAHLDRLPEEVREGLWPEVSELMRSASEGADSFHQLGSLAAIWVNSPAREQSGILLLGVVQASDTQAAQPWVEIAMPSGKQVRLQTNSPIELAAGQRLVALGVIRPDESAGAQPANAADPEIWSNFWILLPPAQ